MARYIPKMESYTPFDELYIVKLNYQKPDGYWVIGHKEEVNVRVEHAYEEKQNHLVAEQEARRRYPGCVIVSVNYV